MEQVSVSFLPRLPEGVDLAGLAVVVVDLLRASTTITYALHAGAKCVVPCRTPDEALEVRRRLASGENSSAPVLLGGERKGVKIDGFDLGNSPSEYTRERVGGCVIAFTTTNGTNAILQSAAGGAGCVAIGCYANLRELVEELVDAGRPVHVNCAGTGGAVTMEDCLFAGRLAFEISARGFQLATTDETYMACALHQLARNEPGGELTLMRISSGGLNLCEIGYDADIGLCRREDVCPVVPVFDVSSGEIRIR